MSGVKTSGRKQRNEDAAADAALLALRLTHRDSALLFVMAAGQGATDAQIANALRNLRPHLTHPDSLEASDGLAGRQSDKKWDNGKEAARQQKKTCTSVQAAETPPSLHAADAFDLLQFLNKLIVFPAEDWSRTWASDRTLMLRMTSKKVREAMDKLCLPTTVKLNSTFLHNVVNFTSATKRSAYKSLSRPTLQALAKERGFKANAENADLVKTLQNSHKCACKTFALKRERMQHILTQLNSWENLISRCRITKLDLSHCGLSDHEAGWLAAVHNEIGAEAAAMLRGELTSLREWEMRNDEDSDYGGKSGGKCRGVDWLAGVLVQCPALAHLDLSGNDLSDGMSKLAKVLPQCTSLAHLNLRSCSSRRGWEYECKDLLSLVQCPSLTHLDLSSNSISDEVALGLRAAWTGDPLELVL